MAKFFNSTGFGASGRDEGDKGEEGDEVDAWELSSGSAAFVAVGDTGSLPGLEAGSS